MGAINTTQHQICVASRPEPVFQNNLPVESTLYLHDLTLYDVQRYVARRLSKLDEVVRNQLSKIFQKRHKGSFCGHIRLFERLGKTGRSHTTSMSNSRQIPGRSTPSTGPH